jgi:hypothetical protein
MKLPFVGTQHQAAQYDRGPEGGADGDWRSSESVPSNRSSSATVAGAQLDAGLRSFQSYSAIASSAGRHLCSAETTVVTGNPSAGHHRLVYKS